MTSVAAASSAGATGAAGASERRFDVVVLGGAIAGGSSALLLRRDAPELSVLVIDKQQRFDEKVGEATTELSGMFFTRRLALWQHLELEHLPKEGLRYWFSNRHVHGHGEASEAGAFHRSTVPSFQLRRDALDEHVLAQAKAEGAVVDRGARVKHVDLGDFDHRVTVETSDGGIEIVRCRWLIDASGRANFLGRKLGLIERNEEHPTAASWCRWKNVRHLDDLAARAGGRLAAGNVTSRRLATNHYVGRGYWVWVIPLGNGETSVGVVWDRRLVALHERTDREAAFLDFVRSIPALAELLDGATPRSEDFRHYSRLAYCTRQYMGRGWAMVGDAAAFLDPYYSPGLDHVGFSVDATVEIVREQARGLTGEALDRRIAAHNEEFLRSYRRFFAAVFKDKYFYMGEHDLLSAAALLDTAQYYLFLVIPAYRVLGRYNWHPVLGPKPAGFNYWLMRFYNRRFKAIAEARRAAGRAGLRNHGRRVRMFFALDFHAFHMALRGAKLWLFAELDLLAIRLGLRRRDPEGAQAEAATETTRREPAPNAEPTTEPTTGRS